MDKHYKPRKIHNLHDLRMEQVRVRNAYRNMELNWIQAILSPEALLTTAVQSLLSPSSKKNNRTGTRSNYFRRLFQKNKKKQQKVSNKNNDAGINDALQKEIPQKEQSRKIKKSYKRLLRNLLIIWQATSLAAFIGTNLFVYFRRKKKEKQATFEM